MSKVLLLLELRGGNDGLNTVVPFADRKYYELRPQIGVPRERIISLDGRIGLHEKLAPLMESWKAGDLAIVQGVGYPNPNRSHFRSVEIWDTASAANETLNEGWIARSLRNVSLPKGAGADCIVADTNALPSAGGTLRTMVMPDAEKFLSEAAAMRAAATKDSQNVALRHILAVRNEVNAAAFGLSDRLRGAPAPAVEYGNALGFGRQLDLATRLVSAKVPLVAIKMAMTGFDTHNAQAPSHERLLDQLASGLSTLRRNLIAAKVWNDVAVLTYSEFGRRAKENANKGTDHGTAAPLFIMGGGVKGGLHGAHPSLTELTEGDLRFVVDFRSIYAVIARECWNVQQGYGLRDVVRLDVFSKP
jgi:uncharacterized protein (DUF1501 family)